MRTVFLGNHTVVVRSRAVRREFASVVALGAWLVEKHFTLNRNLPGPDHRLSSEPAEFRQLVDTVRSAEQHGSDTTMGTLLVGVIGFAIPVFSRVTVQKLPTGRNLDHDDSAFRQPGTGLPPARIEKPSGRRLRRALMAGDMIQNDDCA